MNFILYELYLKKSVIKNRWIRTKLSQFYNLVVFSHRLVLIRVKRKKRIIPDSNMLWHHKFADLTTLGCFPGPDVRWIYLFICLGHFQFISVVPVSLLILLSAMLKSDLVWMVSYMATVARISWVESSLSERVESTAICYLFVESCSLRFLISLSLAWLWRCNLKREERML